MAGLCCYHHRRRRRRLRFGRRHPRHCRYRRLLDHRLLQRPLGMSKYLRRLGAVVAGVHPQAWLERSSIRNRTKDWTTQNICRQGAHPDR